MPTGVYLGTTNGLHFVSSDGGDSWTALTENLPRIRSAKVGTID